MVVAVLVVTRRGMKQQRPRKGEGVVREAPMMEVWDDGIAVVGCVDDKVVLEAGLKHTVKRPPDPGPHSFAVLPLALLGKVRALVPAVAGDNATGGTGRLEVDTVGLVFPNIYGGQGKEWCILVGVGRVEERHHLVLPSVVGGRMPVEVWMHSVYLT